MSDVTMRQVIHCGPPETLMPESQLVREFLYRELPNGGDGGSGEYTYWPDEEAAENLSEAVLKFLDEQKIEIEVGTITRPEAAHRVQEMRRWVRNLKAQGQPIDITFYR